MAFPRIHISCGRNILSLLPVCGGWGTSLTRCLLFCVMSAVLCVPTVGHLRPEGIRIYTPEITAEKATVVVEVETPRHEVPRGCLECELTDVTGAVVGKASYCYDADDKAAELHLPAIEISYPMLWDIEAPSLYTAQVILRSNSGKVLQRVEIPFGIREVEFSNVFGMNLNTRKVPLRGIELERQFMATIPPAEAVAALKGIGCNAVMLPADMALERWLDACDRQGMMVIGRLYDTWDDEGTGRWSMAWQHDIAEWTKGVRNHPSVVMWHLGDAPEADRAVPFDDGGVTPVRLMGVLLRRYDMGRPVSAGVNCSDTVAPALLLEPDVVANRSDYVGATGVWRTTRPWLITLQTDAVVSDVARCPLTDDEGDVGVVLSGLEGLFEDPGDWDGWKLSREGKWLSTLWNNEPVMYIMAGDRELDDPEVDFGATVRTDLEILSNAKRIDLNLDGRLLGTRVNRTDDPAQINRMMWEKLRLPRGTLEAVAYMPDGKILRRTIILK